MISRAERTEAVDDRLRSLLSAGPAEGVALVAHGGYGRRELSVRSDLDVQLVVDERADRAGTAGATRAAEIAEIAERLWYPLWDSGYRLDHAVRTVEETREAAGSDIRTALSMIDARHIAGDPTLTMRLRTSLLTDWRQSAHRRLPELERSCRERVARSGELATQLEPDLKDAGGGLRDGVVLRALAASWLVEVPLAHSARLRRQLLDVRDALHAVAADRSSGRRSDRLLAEWQDEIAERLGLGDRDALLRSVFGAGRAIAHVLEIAWRRVRRALDRPPRRARQRPRPGPPLEPLATGVVLVDGEVGLVPGTPTADPMLPLRAAHAAASRGLLLSPYAADRLRQSYTPLPTPWPPEARRLFAGLLAAGSGLLPVWETLDQVGLVDGWLPEWSAVRCAPQYSPVHRHTVDRHLLETCVEAAGLRQRVARPDLLLLAALLHDIGKVDRETGRHHAAIGARFAQQVAHRIGLADADVGTLTGLVRNHLLLIETATGRDPDDPMTGKQVAVEVGDAGTLELLAALTEADARATGGAAWTPWRERLLHRLVDRVRARLEHGVTPAPVALEAWQMALVDRLVDRPTGHPVEPGDGIEVVISGDQVTVAVAVPAPDRAATDALATDALATVSGALAAAGLSVRAAAVHTVERDPVEVGVSVWWVDGEPPSGAVLRDRIRSARPTRSVLPGDGAPAVCHPPAEPSVRPPDVRVLAGASASATVLQVRARDEPGLFHRICVALSEAGYAVRSAHVDTLAGTAVDVFYLTDPPDSDHDALCAAVRASTGGTGAAEGAGGHR